jgi:multidrug efflux pump subunit AcrA (membrane-fusion protein)
VLTETRTADVEIDIPNPDHVLRPGMFVRVGIGAQNKREALSISRSALLTRGTGRGVYLLGNDLTAMFTPIETGLIEGNRVEVVSGLTEDQTLISSGAQSLNDGDSVRVANGGDL